MERREWGGRMAVGEGVASSAAVAAALSGAAAIREAGAIGDGVARHCASAAARGTRGGGDADTPAFARRARSHQFGFTATEVLVTLAVASVLMSLAVPGFAALARSVGLSSAANELLAALHMARSSAVLRGLPVAVCLTADNSTCVAVPGSAATGWLVFVPEGSAAVTRPAVVGEVLTRFHLPDRLTVSASRPTVTFWPVTRAAATSTFDLCDLAGAGRSIVVSQTGRPRVATEATSCA